MEYQIHEELNLSISTMSKNLQRFKFQLDTMAHNFQLFKLVFVIIFGTSFAVILYLSLNFK